MKRFIFLTIICFLLVGATSLAKPTKKLTPQEIIDVNDVMTSIQPDKAWIERIEASKAYKHTVKRNAKQMLDLEKYRDKALAGEVKCKKRGTGIGPEKVKDGGFSSGNLSAWDTTNGCSVINKECCMDYSGTFTVILLQDGIVPEGSVCIVEYEIKSYTSGTFSVYLGHSPYVPGMSPNSSSGSNGDGTGTYSAEVTAGPGGKILFGSAGIKCIIDNISVKIKDASAVGWVDSIATIADIEHATRLDRPWNSDPNMINDILMLRRCKLDGHLFDPPAGVDPNE